MKIFRSTEKQMKLRVTIPVEQKKLDVEEKISHVKVDGRKKHAQNQGALISLPVEKVVEKKSMETKQKGESNSKEDIKIYIYVYVITR